MRPGGVAPTRALARHRLQAEVGVETDPCPPQKCAVCPGLELHDVVREGSDVEGQVLGAPAARL